MLTAAKDQSAGHQIRVQKAGGIGGRYKLVLKYAPRKGKLKDAVSNDPRFQKTSSSLAWLALLVLSSLSAGGRVRGHQWSTVTGAI